MPINMNATKGARVEKTTKFIAKLKDKFGIEVETIDERLTTVASHKTMTELGVKKDKKKNIVDMMSAVLILQMYLDKNSKWGGFKMDENQNPNVNEEEYDDFEDNVVTLVNEKGEDVEFEYLDTLEVDGLDYLILVPVDDPDDGGVVIFRIEDEGEEETYVGVDIEEFTKVFNAFKEKYKDEYEFED